LWAIRLSRFMYIDPTNLMVHLYILLENYQMQTKYW